MELPEKEGNDIEMLPLLDQPVCTGAMKAIKWTIFWIVVGVTLPIVVQKVFLRGVQAPEWRGLIRQSEHLAKDGRYAQAMVATQSALDVAKRDNGLGDNQDTVKAVRQANYSMGYCLENLALLHKVLAHSTESERKYRQAVACYEKAGDNRLNIARCLEGIASLCEARGAAAEAEPLYLRALETNDAELRLPNRGSAQALSNLGRFYTAQRRYAEAEQHFARALAMFEGEKDHVDDAGVAATLSEMAKLCELQDKIGEAESLRSRAIALYEAIVKKDHRDMARSLSALADLYARQGQADAAERHYLMAIAVIEKAHDAEHPAVADALSALAEVYMSKGLYGSAESVLLRALSIREKAFGNEHPDVATALEAVAKIRRMTRRGDAAGVLEERAKVIRGMVR